METTSPRGAPPGAGAAARAERILICDAVAPEALEELRARGFAPEVRTGLSEDALDAAVAEVEALVVRSATKITRRVLAAAPRLTVVGRAGVGVDNVDLDAATEHGVLVMNTPEGNTVTTAELALALLFALSRHVPRADRAVRAGDWKQRGKLLGSELTGKTLGVVGLGRIGRAVAERALGLQMQVVAHDPFVATDRSPVEGVELTALDELLARADFVTLHVPLSDATRHLIDARALALMKPGARLVNAARGGLVDEQALAAALAAGHLRGAALDVLEREPPPADHPLLAREDVVLTPHLGASSDEAQRNVAVDIARQIADYLADGVAVNAVNAPATSKQTLRAIAPYVLLAEKMGSFLAQRAGAPLQTVELSLRGEVARADTSHVKLALLVGILRHGSEGPVNFVSAPRLARERGLRLLETSDDDPGVLHSAVAARGECRGGGPGCYVEGTVLGREPRFVRIDDTHLDLIPQGPLLITEHDDQPGVVGLLGTLLGRHGVNIRRIELGPPEQGNAGLARGFLTLYDRPSAACLAELEQLAPVRSVQLVQL